MLFVRPHYSLFIEMAGAILKHLSATATLSSSMVMSIGRMKPRFSRSYELSMALSIFKPLAWAHIRYLRPSSLEMDDDSDSRIGFLMGGHPKSNFLAT